MPEERLNDELDALETALASLSPKGSGVDRDRVMYLAGRAAARKSPLPAERVGTSRLWHVATALSLLTAVSFGGMLLVRGGPEVVYIYRNEPTGVSQPDRPEVAVQDDHRPQQVQILADYLRLRRLVLADGLNALPSRKPRPGSRGSVPKWGPEQVEDLEAILGGLS